MATDVYEFLPFTEQRMTATSTAWLEDAANGLSFPSETERLLQWASAHREISDTDSMAFGVFLKGKTVASGICDVVIQRRSVRSKWIKMLKLNLKPNVDAQLLDGNSDAATDVFVAAIVGSIGLQLTHKASTLKVYGRTNSQLTFLKAVVGHLDQRFKDNAIQSIKATVEGRFLCLVFT